MNAGSHVSPRIYRALSIAAVTVFYTALIGVSLEASFGGSASRSVGAGSFAEPGARSGPDYSFDSGGAATDETLVGADGVTPAGSSGSRAASAGSGSTRSSGSRATTPSAGQSALSPISIGIHDDNTAAAGSAYGVNGLGGNQMPFVRDIVDWINKNGGMGGRQVEIVPHVTENLEGSFDQQAQEACVAFAEDHQVDVVVSGARIPTLNLVDCLAQHNTPLVWDYHFMADRVALEKYANFLYMPSMIRAERMGGWIDSVADTGFFDQGTIGLVRYDEPVSKRLSDEVIKPHLAARGLKIVDEAAFRPAAGASSAADISAQSNSTVLRFRSAGIDRVILAPTAGVMPLLFLTAAESQSYRPRYTYTSYDIPSFQAENANANQLGGSVAFGWLPAGDVTQAYQPPLNPTAKLCVQITADAMPPANGGIRRFCSGLMFLKAAFDRGADVAPASLRRVVDSFGSEFESPWTFQTFMSATRHDGASVGRIVVYDAKCACYQYSGSDRAIP